ncbi:hypothetical protein Acr_22g0001400 [Actinidia rufa]|uniref:SWIM-type domain-containing protein n=1 Tax=Actinidia rufa TaxID=165716 RepID=A0A7J0GJ27_9ERIC|nr:hypothetical protein Acr_22g0001400 [Actinidia rufa]
MTTMVMFYWGGKIIRDRREGISYDIDATVCYDVELGTSVAQLRDMIIPRVAEYGEHVSIKFICRYPHRRNGDVMIYKKLPINDDRTLQNVLNIPSRHPDHQHVEIYVVKEEVITMNTSGSHTVVGWADVHTYGELLSGKGDLSTLGSFTQMLALGQSSRSTLAEEAPGQRMCSLFGQGECIEAGGASGSVDPVERLVALGETGTQDNEDADVFQSDNSDEDIEVLLTNEANDDFDDDGQENPNVGEALHYNPHIPFFTNLVGADDVVGGRDLYDGCPTWSDVTPEFAKGMVFKDKDAVIRACNCHDCPWKLRACLKKQHGFFEIKQYPGPHTCLHGMDSLDHRNINSTFIAHLIKTQVAEDPGWKIASIVENVKNHSGFTVSYKKAWLGRTKAIAMVFGDWDSSYEKLPRFMRTLELRNPGTAVILETLDLAIISAVKHEWETARLGQPIGIHRYCLRHFRSNYQKNFGNVKVKDLIWKAGTAHQVRKFDEAMDEIKKLGTNSESAARAYRALCNEDPRKWTLAHDGGYRWGVTTTNDSECYNNVLRGARDLPITSCVEVTFYRLVATFNDKRRQIESALAKGLRYTSKVQAKLEEYQARSAGHHVTICNWASGSAEVVTSAAGTTGNNKHAVYLNPPSCDCGKWMIYHYPCSHMLAVCAKSGRQPWHLIDPKYKIEVYAHVYNTSFEPMVHEHYWAAYDGPKIIPHPSRRRDPTSGRPTKRIHNEMDISRKRQNNHCGPMDTVCSPGPIDGTVLTLQAHHRSTRIWEHGAQMRSHADVVAQDLQECQDICMQAFGVIPPAEEIDSGRLRMSWLRHTFDILPEHADDVSVQRHARAYILRLIGGLLLTGYSQTLVRVAIPPLFTRPGRCRGIFGHASDSRVCARIAWNDHTAGQQPLLIGGVHFPGGPWGARWRSRFRTTTTSTHVVRVYRDQLDRLRPDEFTWRPYDAIMHELPDYCRVGSDIWVSRSPLVCFEVVEWHSTRVELATLRSYMIALIVPSMRTISQSHYRTCTMPVTCVADHFHALHEHQRIGQPRVPDPTTTMTPGFPSTSSSQQFTQYVGATQTSASYVTPTMPSYTYHMSSHDMPSSSRPSSSGVRPRRTTHRHITSPVTYDQSSSFLPVGDEEEFDGYVDPYCIWEADRDTCLSRGSFTDHTDRVTATATTRNAARATARDAAHID